LPRLATVAKYRICRRSGVTTQASVRPAKRMQRQPRVVGEQQLALVPQRARAYGRSTPRSAEGDAMAATQGTAPHHEVVDVTTSKRPNVLIVVTSTSTSRTPDCSFA